MYRKVTELTRDELDELRWNYFYNLSESEREEEGYSFPDDIPDFVLHDWYGGFSFVKDDFFCNMED